VRIVKIASAADHQGGVAFATHPGRPIGRRIAAQTGESRSKAGLVAKRELLPLHIIGLHLLLHSTILCALTS
jgi:hypothetical protein